MSRDTRLLLVLTLFCTLAGAFFGFGTITFSFQSAYNGSGREPVFFSPARSSTWSSPSYSS